MGISVAKESYSDQLYPRPWCSRPAKPVFRLIDTLYHRGLLFLYLWASTQRDQPQTHCNKISSGQFREGRRKIWNSSFMWMEQTQTSVQFCPGGQTWKLEGSLTKRIGLSRDQEVAENTLHEFLHAMLCLDSLEINNSYTNIWYFLPQQSPM